MVGISMIVETSVKENPCKDVATFLSEGDFQSFSANGFLAVTGISSSAELSEIRRVLADLIARRAGEKEGALFDTMESSTSSGVPASIQLTDPSNYNAWLLETDYVRNATRIAQQLLPNCFLRCNFVLLKRAKVGSGTPWHQDEAYFDPQYDHATLTFWMPLQDVGPNDGCMIYVPGSPQMGMLEHRSLHGDTHTHSFECAVSFNQDQCATVPLRAGDCVIHGQRTLHRSTNNESSVDRYAYILSFVTSPTLREKPRKAPWLEQRQSVEQQMRRTWMLRGGFFVILVRKMRRLRSLTPSMYMVYFRKGMHGILRAHR
jgi:ectoine hydroxylase-related dioxygenase (phytanoyl-CoA dioxygenase family)